MRRVRVVAEQVQPPLLGVVELHRFVRKQLPIFGLEATPSLLKSHAFFDERRNQVDVARNEILDLRRRLRIIHVGPDIEIVGRRRNERRNLARLHDLPLQIWIR